MPGRSIYIKIRTSRKYSQYKTTLLLSQVFVDLPFPTASIPNFPVDDESAINYQVVGGGDGRCGISWI